MRRFLRVLRDLCFGRKFEDYSKKIISNETYHFFAAAKNRSILHRWDIVMGNHIFINDPDRSPHNATSDLGHYCLLMSKKSRLNVSNDVNFVHDHCLIAIVYCFAEYP